jgi:eukaryotic-like serine/threonine-protein kinase
MPIDGGGGIPVESEAARISDLIQLGREFELDLRGYELRRSGRALKLERIPMELLLLLVRERGQLVTREHIVEHIWGKDIFLDADNSINAAIRKIRQALKDDPEHPRFIQTVTGKGYRFIAPTVPISPAPRQEGPVPRHGSSAQSSSQENLIGRKISHYRVLQLLGGGGMGVVYRGEDLRLGRSVAIKFLPVEVGSSPTAVSRMYNEARAASALEHPNICPVHELGDDHGQPFIVMQLLEGQTLREWIAQATDQASASCLKQLVSFAVQVCRGLEAAHDKGIIHRDIKPANIFITNRGEAKILDFGVAKFTHSANSAGDNVNGAVAPETLHPENEPGSATDQLSDDCIESVGTPSYLSPEQVGREKLDTRTDLFSFGLVLYEMATGQKAFSGNTAAAIQEAVLHMPAVPARDLRPGLPAELDAIISKAIEKDRARRYQTAAEMKADLEKLVLPVASFPSASADALQSTNTAGKAWRLTLLALFALTLAALVAFLFYYRAHISRRLTDSDTIVIADFSNSTGASIFDQTLKQGLNVALQQSPFLSIVSDDKVSSTLRLMTRPPDTVLTPELAREVCQRAGSKAYIEGAIAALGSEYVIGLKAVNCQTGDVLARQQVTAPSKEKVIVVLGQAAARLRGELGESLATLQQHDVPLPQATTSSLEALQAYSMGYAEACRGRYEQAVPFYKRAIELDPDFATAYAHLGQAYANSGKNDLAVANIKLAYDRQSHASEPEKFYIVTRYHELVTGEIEKRIEALQLWKQMYPRDDVPPNDLAAEYTDMGKYEQGLQEAQEEVRLSPTLHTGYELLGISYLGLNKFADAKAVREKEVQLKIDYYWDHVDLYSIAFQQHDSAGMQRELEWARSSKQGYLMWKTAAGDLASLGKVHEAKAAFRQAADRAQQNGLADASSSISIDQALAEVLLGESVKTPRNLLALAGSNSNTLTNAGRLSAMTGDFRQARAIAEALSGVSPRDTYVNEVWIPSIRADVEIGRGNPTHALELLQSAAPYEFGWRTQFWPNYVRGRAYLRAGRPIEAAAEFKKILARPGVSLARSLDPLIYSLSHLELARAFALAGDNKSAISAYDQFLDLFKDADPDVPVLHQARAELAKLH